MGKRSDFERNPRDFYPSPIEVVYPLLRHVSGEFIEPCAGDGRLIRHLERFGLKCTYACDIEPLAKGIEKKDVLFFGEKLPPAKQIITNCPWDRKILHPMIETFRIHAPTWLLFDSDWMFTEQAKPYLSFCEKIISVGRVSWLDNGVSGMENCAWFRFVKDEVQTVFIP